MFQRLKGAIDAIAEEQARQKALPTSPSRSSSSTRRLPRPGSPSKRHGRAAKEPERVDHDAFAKEPDPSVFEAAFVIDDVDVSGTSGTPLSEASATAKPEDAAHQERALAAGNTPDATEASTTSTASITPVPPSVPVPASAPAPALAAEAASKPGTAGYPTEVRVKLRKLEKVEARYHELLKSYRVAHARGRSIEPFEASLREHTPLTSIDDPGALVEYLNQITLKGDLVMDELKRVAADRDVQKQQLVEAEKSAREAWDALREQREGAGEPRSETSAPRVNGDRSQDPDEPRQKPSSSSITSPILSVLTKSPFSPKGLPPEAKDDVESEDFFSYESELPRLEAEVHERDAHIRRLRAEVTSLKGDLAVARESTEGMVQSLESATRELNTLRDGRERHERETRELRAALEQESNRMRAELDAAHESLRRSAPPAQASPTGSMEKAPTLGEGATGSAAPDAHERAPADQADGSKQTIAKLEEERQSLRAQLGARDNEVKKLEARRKSEEELQEEIESLRDDLIHVGQDHVVAKERIKEMEAAHSTLEQRIRELEATPSHDEGPDRASPPPLDGTVPDVAVEMEKLQRRISTLQTDLSAAQHLATARFKDVTELRDVLQKAQPEVAALRAEAVEVKVVKDELAARSADLSRVEGRETSLRAEVADLKKQVAQRVADVKSLQDKINQQRVDQLKADDAAAAAEREARKAQLERKDAMDAHASVQRDLAKAREEASTSRARVRALEQQHARTEGILHGLREEMELKTAQHASAESLMASMRDQTAEMAMQMKEARERCESLEEELGDAHRLLSERSREGETMRRLLADVEARAEDKVRDFKGQMELAVEERDRAEDEARTMSRKRAREVEELKGKVRDAERQRARAEEGRSELAAAEQEWTRRRDELERRAQQSAAEVTEVRQAMGELRDALDESERRTREVDRQKMELRRHLEEAQGKLERLKKSQAMASEELRVLKAARPRAVESARPSSRSSTESSGSRPPLPGKLRTVSAESPSRAGAGNMDYVYLKNVLLQFLEQRDKKHQMQLIPVLGMLLHFDRQDEQKWMTAVNSMRV
ncbi:MAG: hypothetical protein M1838_001735 [Thelocarpon superellum]|nr:MAG: hypothetical protein M1838_001735 [Thelocarpon superellum]